MRNAIRIGLILLAALTPLAALSVFVAYDALQQEPSFYRAAVEMDEDSQEEASDQCVQQAFELANDVGRRGQWQALFTAEQINGWLAVELVKRFPDVLESDVRDPRVAIRKNQATFACRYDAGKTPGVYSLTFDVYLSAPNVVAVRILKARLGVLPVPLGQVLEAISTAAQHADLPLEWRQDQGDPVALITIPPPQDKHDRMLELETIQLRDGEVLFAGHTGDALPKSGPSEKASEADGQTAQVDSESAAEPRVGKSASKKNRQR